MQLDSSSLKNNTACAAKAFVSLLILLIQTAALQMRLFWEGGQSIAGRTTTNGTTWRWYMMKQTALLLSFMDGVQNPKRKGTGEAMALFFRLATSKITEYRVGAGPSVGYQRRLSGFAASRKPRPVENVCGSSFSRPISRHCTMHIK